jgi:hypothetical protein
MYRDFSVRYRAMRVSTGTVTESSPGSADTWVRLVLMGEYDWFQ